MNIRGGRQVVFRLCGWQTLTLAEPGSQGWRAVPSCPQLRATPSRALSTLHRTREPCKPGKGIRGLVMDPGFSTA